MKLKGFNHNRSFPKMIRYGKMGHHNKNHMNYNKNFEDRKWKTKFRRVGFCDLCFGFYIDETIPF